MNSTLKIFVLSCHFQWSHRLSEPIYCRKPWPICPNWWASAALRLSKILLWQRALKGTPKHVHICEWACGTRGGAQGSNGGRPSSLRVGMWKSLHTSKISLWSRTEKSSMLMTAKRKVTATASAGLTLSDVTQVCGKLEGACRRFSYSGTGLALPQELCSFHGSLRRMEMKSAKQTMLESFWVE